MLLVEQNAALALELSDYAYVMDVGRIRFEGASRELAGSMRCAGSIWRVPQERCPGPPDTPPVSVRC